MFGEPALRLAKELERVADSGIPAGWNPGEALKPVQAEGLRKLLLSLASDVRLVLLRLALQLVRLRHLKGATADEQQRAALETREIYAPLANSTRHLAPQVGTRGPNSGGTPTQDKCQD